MQEYINPILIYIYNIQYMEVVRTLAPVATAIIAFKALKNWQKQDKAKRESEFLDQILEQSNKFCLDLARPVTLLDYIKIGIRAQVNDREEIEESEKFYKGAVTYIKKHGKEDGKRLFKELEPLKDSLSQLKSLSVKGQIFGFKNYEKCFENINLITWQFDRLQAVAGIISDTNLYWENKKIRETVLKVIALEKDDIWKTVGDSNKNLIAYVAEIYKNIYT